MVIALGPCWPLYRWPPPFDSFDMDSFDMDRFDLIDQRVTAFSQSRQRRNSMTQFLVMQAHRRQIRVDASMVMRLAFIMR
jgi:hypothetical protein